MRLQDEPDLPLQINVVPMIDVMFALLTFFIMSSLFLTRSEGLPVNLPQAGTAQQQASAPITVTIDKAGQISLNRQPTGVDALAEQVSKLTGSNQETLVIINADEQVSHGHVVAVMDRLRQLKGVKLAIAAQKP
ncbi:biopolymer transporter ExbD [Aetokthonos hydrillicola Thurmond2011]|uniref:Biopolymer transporter ExbD n=1 Tax=Aetokthonos hydrillicola Thurmond2011 TaxID=2712845 RepID=A0AAP5M8X8_9CYAN|nr:biopolymer transporter ExbD [Aetokthonos hydrillicola]MBO3461841.1 biopolymer transporter ExbD [Aetokthonos hydrillicola CCALA 1050]MBW4588873.1 biopolymer transporter ExbD [Aetokthonos hydrillicola CCALA 1050]MDR9894078.1 biopolymer transporter ExbD [Aetokthonos hydrillicola Thurmond2011]